MKNNRNGIYENKEICKKCKPSCCVLATASILPRDMKEVSYDCIKSQLETGYVSIIKVHREEDPFYIMKTRAMGKHIAYSYKEWDDLEEGVCSLYRKKGGCILYFKERPIYCQKLIPDAGGNCEQECNENPYELWYDHKEILQQLYGEFLRKRKLSDIKLNHIVRRAKEKGRNIYYKVQ